MTSARSLRSGGRTALLTRVALVAGVLAVVAAVVGYAFTRPSDVGRTAVEVAAQAPADAPSPAAAGGSAAETVPPPPAPPAPPDVGRRDAAPVAAPAVAAPVALEVPALGVRAEVDPVGVEPDGSMTIPADPDRVGWYRFGPAPGAAQGSAVLAGHVDTARDGPGAFAALTGVEVGQDVLVTLDDGSVRTYRVEGREAVVKRELPVDVLFARDGPARLTLITCGGPFQPELRSYRDNLVVTAVPVVP